MSEEQNVQTPIFEDILYKKHNDLIIKEIEKLEFGTALKYQYYDTLVCHCFEELEYEKNGIVFCNFACDYAFKFWNRISGNGCNKWCEHCPFENIDLNQYCFNNASCIVEFLYNELQHISKDKFNKHKRICIEQLIKIRDWPIKEGVLCRSKITK